MVTAVLENELFGNKDRFRKQKQTEPEVIVFADWKGFVEIPDGGKDFAAQQNRGWADQAMKEAPIKKPEWGLVEVGGWHYLVSGTNPSLPRVRGKSLGLLKDCL